jgi:hypothetical protein
LPCVIDTSAIGCTANKTIYARAATSENIEDFVVRIIALDAGVPRGQVEGPGIRASAGSAVLAGVRARRAGSAGLVEPCIGWQTVATVIGPLLVGWAPVLACIGVGVPKLTVAFADTKTVVPPRSRSVGAHEAIETTIGAITVGRTHTP